METGLITSSNAVATGTSKAPSKDLDKDAFLKLLVAQLKNQDPTSNQDPSQMLQQMTSLSSLEQMQSTNKLLQEIQAQNLGIFQAQSANLVGKHARIASSSFDLKDHQAKLGVDLEASAKVTLVIKDAAGKTVASLDQGTQTAGSHRVAWDGRDAQGNQLQDGAYTVEVKAVDANGKAVNAATSLFALVESISFLGGNTLIQAAGRHFNLADIAEITL